MVWEIAQLDAKPGEEAAFEAAVAKGAPLFERARGCKSLQLFRCVEQPGRYRLLIEWESVEDHTVHFRESPARDEWRRLIDGLYVGTPAIDHMQPVLKGF